MTKRPRCWARSMPLYVQGECMFCCYPSCAQYLGSVPTSSPGGVEVIELSFVELAVCWVWCLTLLTSLQAKKFDKEPEVRLAISASGIVINKADDVRMRASKRWHH